MVNHPNRSKFHNVRGIWSDGRGYIDTLGRSPFVRVELVDGKLYDDEFGERLYCRQYGNDCPIITNGCWEFWPDESELVRLNITPKQMIA